MSFFRSSMMRSAVLRPATSFAPRAQFHTARALRAGDYGSGDGNPAAEKPQQQGKNPREDLEHPGPPPPKAGQGNKTSPDSESFNSSSSGSSKSLGSGKSSNETTSGDGKKAEPTDKDVKGSKGAQPKILKEGTPEEESEDVKEHNREMKERADKAHERSE